MEGDKHRVRVPLPLWSCTRCVDTVKEDCLKKEDKKGDCEDDDMALDFLLCVDIDDTVRLESFLFLLIDCDFVLPDEPSARCGLFPE